VQLARASAPNHPAVDRHTDRKNPLLQRNKPDVSKPRPAHRSAGESEARNSGRPDDHVVGEFLREEAPQRSPAQAPYGSAHRDLRLCTRSLLASVTVPCIRR